MAVTLAPGGPRHTLTQASSVVPHVSLEDIQAHSGQVTSHNLCVLFKSNSFFPVAQLQSLELTVHLCLPW